MMTKMVWTRFGVVALLLLLLTVSTKFARGQDVITCSGFVESSAELDELYKSRKGDAGDRIDFSSVSVKLLTTDGVLKYSIDCSPNGNYFMPVYDKGSFIIKITGPDGWAFEPSSVPIKITDTENDCAADVLFKFTGFSVIGEVVSRRVASCKTDLSSASRGPSGIELSLVSNATNSVVRSSISDAGSFVFENVFPGKYKVIAKHKSWSVLPAEQKVEVGLQSAVLENPFSVDGFSLSGKVASGSVANSGVEVFLFADKDDKFACDPIPSSVYAPTYQGKEAKCYSKSNAEGVFRFQNLPCSSVSLVPRFVKVSAAGGASTVFDVSPGHVDVEVLNGDVKLGSVFEVTGFTVTGKVVNSDGSGIPEVVISVNGEQRATSDANGLYTLTRLTPGSYTVAAKKNHYVFTQLTSFDLSSSSAPLPDIKVSKFDLCGRVEIGSTGSKRELSLTSGSETFKTFANQNGEYCFSVAPGSYKVLPIVSATEKANGFFLSPPQRSIEIKNSPYLRADFFQASVAVYGSVICLDKSCPNKVPVTLKRSGAAADTSLATETDPTGAFVFRDISPGSYVLEGSVENWCWDSNPPPFRLNTTISKVLVWCRVAIWFNLRLLMKLCWNMLPRLFRTSRDQ
eukprot:TRINITY_DN5777_c0_g1_i1.p1 TRINITY_DN5777_c0_g1~~TRINITY_DN5777_c0_g1_i1.p1  ORF type:complete len:627 (-),score=189.14 TRINITY_DN5777_c0_g1_i1:1807-3687(-)